MKQWFAGTCPSPFTRLPDLTFGPSTIGGIDLLGRPVAVDAGVNAQQTRVDNTFLTVEQQHTYEPEFTNPVDGAMVGSQVHYSTIVWWAQSWALADLG